MFQSGVDCTEEVSSLFRGELNPVAAKAQKKVQIPEGYVQTCYVLLHFVEYYKTKKYIPVPLKNSPMKICVLIGLKSCFSIERHS